MPPLHACLPEGLSGGGCTYLSTCGTTGHERMRRIGGGILAESFVAEGLAEGRRLLGPNAQKGHSLWWGGRWLGRESRERSFSLSLRQTPGKATERFIYLHNDSVLPRTG